MSTIEAAAMWVDDNVTFSVARTIICHLNSIFKHHVQVQFSQIQLLGEVITSLEPKFEEFIYRKTEEKKG